MEDSEAEFPNAGFRYRHLFKYRDGFKFREDRIDEYNLNDIVKVILHFAEQDFIGLEFLHINSGISLDITKDSDRLTLGRENQLVSYRCSFLELYNEFKDRF